MFGKKKNKYVQINSEEAKEVTIPVYFGGQQVGEVIHLKAKEINGLDHLEFWIRLTFGSGLETQMRDVIISQGIYLGKPPE